jgi:hypothetical protein
MGQFHNDTIPFGESVFLAQYNIAVKDAKIVKKLCILPRHQSC